MQTIANESSESCAGGAESWEGGLADEAGHIGDSLPATGRITRPDVDAPSPGRRVAAGFRTSIPSECRRPRVSADWMDLRVRAIATPLRNKGITPGEPSPRWEEDRIGHRFRHRVRQNFAGRMTRTPWTRVTGFGATSAGIPGAGARPGRPGGPGEDGRLAGADLNANVRTEWAIPSPGEAGPPTSPWRESWAA